MKLIRCFGLATATAMVAMAFIGSSSASATYATVICNEESSSLECPVEKRTTTIHAVASEPLLHTSTVDIKCTSSLLKASVLELGNPQVMHLEELTWAGCKTHGGTNCEKKTVLLGLFNILKLSTSDAHVTSTGGTVVLVKCGSFIHCHYGGKFTLLALSANGPAVATLHANTTMSLDDHDLNDICPSTITWLALYDSLTPFWIRGVTF